MIILEERLCRVFCTTVFSFIAEISDRSPLESFSPLDILFWTITFRSGSVLWNNSHRQPCLVHWCRHIQPDSSQWIIRQMPRLSIFMRVHAAERSRTLSASSSNVFCHLLIHWERNQAYFTTIAHFTTNYLFSSSKIKFIASQCFKNTTGDFENRNTGDLNDVLFSWEIQSSSPLRNAALF